CASGRRYPHATRAPARTGLARTHTLGAAAACAALSQGGGAAPGEAARRPTARSAARRRAGHARAALPAGGERAAAKRRARRRARAVWLAAGRVARVALRAGAAYACAGVGQAAGQALAERAPMSVARSLLYAAANVLHPRMLWLMLWPMLIALALWGSVALAAWGTLAMRLAGWLEGALDYALAWSQLDFGTAALVAANVLLFIAFVPLVYLTALFILSLFGMQQMVDYVASRSYPRLERRRGGGIAGSGWNGLAAFAGMLALGVLSVPFWLLPPLWPIIPLVILGWVNQRLLRYDALAEHADAYEM